MEKTNSKLQQFNNSMQKILTNPYWILINLTIGFIGWIWGCDMFTIPILAIFTLLTFLFCDHVNNIFPIVFSVAFFISKISSMTQIIIFAVSIALFLIGAIYFIIKNFLRKKPMTKGKLFYPMIVAAIVCIFGGFVYSFNILTALIILAFCLVAYLLYFLAVNFTHNFKLYINYTFVLIGLMLFAMLLVSYFMGEETFLSNITTKSVIFIGLQHINTVAVYFIFALISSIQLGLKSKYDYLYSLLAIFYAMCTYFTYARMATLICLIFLVVTIIYTFVKSDNKKIYLWLGLALILISGVACAFMFDTIKELVSWHMNLGVSGNGRNVLWPWCVDKFLESPVFGVGFISDDPVPALVTTDAIILAHNSLLQYLTSTGIVGTLLISYFYVEKYLICCNNFNTFKLLNLFQVLVIALVGIVDQCPTMDIFIIIITLVFVSLAETDKDECTIHKHAKRKQTNKKTPNHSEIQ